MANKVMKEKKKRGKEKREEKKERRGKKWNGNLMKCKEMKGKER